MNAVYRSIFPVQNDSRIAVPAGIPIAYAQHSEQTEHPQQRHDGVLLVLSRVYRTIRIVRYQLFIWEISDVDFPGISYFVECLLVSAILGNDLH